MKMFLGKFFRNFFNPPMTPAEKLAALLEETPLRPTICTREIGHSGPCNGLPRRDEQDAIIDEFMERTTDAHGGLIEPIVVPPAPLAAAPTYAELGPVVKFCDTCGTPLIQVAASAKRAAHYRHARAVIGYRCPTVRVPKKAEVPVGNTGTN